MTIRFPLALRIGLKAAISAALLAALFLHTPLAQIGGVLSRLSPAAALAGLALAFATWGLSAFRLWLLAFGFPLGAVTRMTFVGMYYGTVLPGQVAGDVVKAYRLGAGASAPGLAAAATFVDRAVALAGLLVASAIAMPWVGELPSRLGTTVAVAAAASVLILVLGSHRRVRRLLPDVPPGGKSGPGRIAASFASGLRQVLERHGRLAANFAVAVAYHAVCVAIHIIVGSALGIELSFAAWCVTYAGVSLLTLLPVSIAGLGMREGGYVGLLGLFGIAPPQALSLSLLIFGYALVGALAGAVADFPGRSKSPR